MSPSDAPDQLSKESRNLDPMGPRGSSAPPPQYGRCPGRGPSVATSSMLLLLLLLLSPPQAARASPRTPQSCTSRARQEASQEERQQTTNWEQQRTPYRADSSNDSNGDADYYSFALAYYAALRAEEDGDNALLVAIRTLSSFKS